MRPSRPTESATPFSRCSSPSGRVGLLTTTSRPPPCGGVGASCISPPADAWPGESTRVGAFLRRILPYAYRSHRRVLGLEGIHLHDAVGLLAAIQPELFGTQSIAGDVETLGEWTTGATIFDRRPNPEWRRKLEVATTLDVVGATEAIVRSLAERWA